jgi:Holliday junction DNA helicase RuvA
MIITLTGKVSHKDSDFAVIEASGVGYRVFLNPSVMRKLEVGSPARLWTYEHVREDSREIYGFTSIQELRLFGKLLAISGVGPKMAQNILGLGTVPEVESAVERGDIDLLSRVPRVGRKTAQKIILELKGRLVERGDGNTEEQQVVAALVGMGYGREDARTAVSRTEGSDVKSRLRSALRELGKR